MEIKQKLTNINYNKGNNKQNKFLVIHYVGAVSTALNNANYFENVNRNASANYFVDDNDIYQVVKDSDVAWHCGDKLKAGNGGAYYNKCTNYNSIGIEMCCYDNNGTLDISNKTIENTIELVKYLMNKYNIPLENVIRHYDVTNKICPAPFVVNESRWNDFKARLNGGVTPQPKPTEPDYTGTITYQAYTTKWLPEVNKCDNTPDGYAGIGKEPITGFRCKPQYGELIYEARQLSNHQWLGAVNSKDYNKNDGSSYAGLYGRKIDGIRIKSTRGYVDYRVKTIEDGWLPWCRGWGETGNLYAGIKGHTIIGIQMK